MFIKDTQKGKERFLICTLAMYLPTNSSSPQGALPSLTQKSAVLGPTGLEGECQGLHAAGSVQFCKRRPNLGFGFDSDDRTFIGRTDAEAETPILWPPDAKN